MCTGRGSNQGPLGSKSDALTTAPLRHLGFFGEQGIKGIYFRGTGEQRPNFEGNSGHKKTNFRFWGNRGTSKFIGNKGTGTPTGRASRVVCTGIHYFLIFATKHRLWVLVRTASQSMF